VRNGRPCEPVTAIGLSVVSRVQDSDKRYKMQDPFVLLRKYPTPETLSVLDKDVLGEEMRKRSRGKLKEHHADMLINLARKYRRHQGRSGRVIHGYKAYPHPIGDADNLIAELESEMEIALGRYPIVQSCFPSKGLGVVSVAGIIGEIGDFKKFNTRSRDHETGRSGPLRDKFR